MQNSKKLRLILTVILFFYVVAGCGRSEVEKNNAKVDINVESNYTPVQEKGNNEEILKNLEEAVVSRVVDGDTIEIQDGKKIRLKGYLFSYFSEDK